MKLLTLALNDYYKGKLRFKQNGHFTESYFWRIQDSKNGYKVIAQNNGYCDDYVITDNANNLEDIITAIEKDA